MLQSVTDRLRDLPVPVSGEGAEKVGEEEVVQGVEVQLAEQELRDPPRPHHGRLRRRER